MPPRLPLNTFPFFHHTCRCSHRTFSTTARAQDALRLAYDLHEPPKHAPPRPPIVFMHGLFGSKRNNRSISKVLARDLGRPVYCVDLRNHGDSPHDRTHTYPAMADDIEAFLAQHALSRPTLIGHSMGAKVAMTVALRNNNDKNPASPNSGVAALVAVDNAPVDAALQSDFAAYLRGMRRIEAARVQRQADADAIMTEYAPELPIRQFLLANLIRAPPSTTSSPSDTHLIFRVPLDTLAGALGHMADFPVRDPEQARFEGPALFVRGARSRYVADETLPVVGRFFPRFELRDVDAGHWLISERPEEFRRAVVEFLQDKE